MNTTKAGVKYYRPREVARLGLIKNSTGNDKVESNYRFIIMQIKIGNIKAKNHGAGKKPYYLISEKEIERYHETTV